MKNLIVLNIFPLDEEEYQKKGIFPIDKKNITPIGEYYLNLFTQPSGKNVEGGGINKTYPANLLDKHCEGRAVINATRVAYTYPGHMGARGQYYSPVTQDAYIFVV